MNKKILCMSLALIMLTGCGSSGSSAPSDSYKSAAPTNSYNSGAVNYAEDTVAMASEECYEDDADYSERGGEMADTSAETPTQTPLENTAKMVYTGTVELETLEYDKAVEGIKADIESMGGFVENSAESNTNNRWYYDKSYITDRKYTVRARIPSENFNGFIAKLPDYGQKMYESTNAENISRRYADTDAQVKALEKEEARLLDMMESAVTIEDMINVEDRITQVQSQLNSLRSSLASMDTDVRYSTVNVTVTEVHEYTEIVTEPEPEPTFLERLWTQVSDSGKAFLEVLEGLLFFIIAVFPYLVIGGIILFFVLRHHKKKKAAKNIPAPNYNTAAQNTTQGTAPEQSDNTDNDSK